MVSKVLSFSSKFTPVFKMIIILICLIGALSATTTPDSLDECNREKVTIFANTTEAFVFKIDPGLFNWTKEAFAEEEGRYLLQYNNSFDVPDWLSRRFEQSQKSLYIFGSPPRNTEVAMLRAIVVSDQTFEVESALLKLVVTEREEYAKYAVQVMVRNVNMDDFYDNKKMNDVLDLFKQQFWKSSEGKLYFTYIQTAENVPGERHPLNPTEKEGVLVHIGCACNFSTDLLELKSEISIAMKNICPGRAKRVSVERFVREKGLIFDWCYFKLVEVDSFNPPRRLRKKYSLEDDVDPLLDNDTYVLPEKDDPWLKDSDYTVIGG